MRKEHKLLICTALSVLPFILFTNAHAEALVHEDAVLLKSKGYSPLLNKEEHVNYSTNVKSQDPIEEFNNLHNLSARKGLSGTEEINPELQALINKSISLSNPIITQEQNSLEDLSSRTPVVKTIAGLTLSDIKEMLKFASLSYTDTFDTAEGKAMVTKLKSDGWSVVEFKTPAERSGIILLRGKEAIVSYHGSESLRNWATDAYATKSKIGWAPGYAHTGILQGFEKTWPQVYKALKHQATQQGISLKDLKVEFTGHSLGGALTTLAAMRLATLTDAKPKVATFASPRVLDRDAAAFYNKVCPNTVRVVHKDSTSKVDPVALLGPGLLGFKHAGALVELKDGGSVPHVRAGYFNGLDQIKDEDFAAKTGGGNKVFNYLNSWLYPLNGDDPLAENGGGNSLLKRLSSWIYALKSDYYITTSAKYLRSIAPDKWIEVQMMAPEERAAYINLRTISLALNHAQATKARTDIIGDLTYQLLQATTQYELVRDQHLKG